ncbi:DgyrCDS947 [Dimorphilus gyrociliatus]|uniref:RING-type E3 ubiquitin transferase n=1 Tax=Dimorphilus gyrociliatus TaxID=2664684 RepID=A0A7I8V7M1_9ANNE|nr:DgyrCDS947 [Dimorphilus gyrociliatus]
MSRRSVRLKAKMEERLSPRPKSPKNCSICLGETENKCFTDECSHEFCFVCLMEWSKVKAECPLCKRKFKKIMYNIRSYSDCDEYIVPVIDRSDPIGIEPTLSSINPLTYFGAFRHRHARLPNRETLTPGFREPVIDSHLSRLHESFMVGSLRFKRHMNSRWRNSESFRESSTSSRELSEWVRRELLNIFTSSGRYSSLHSSFEEIVSQVLDAIDRHPVDSIPLRNMLQVHLGNGTDEFIFKLRYHAPRGHSSRNCFSNLNNGDDDVVVLNDNSLTVNTESNSRRRKRPAQKRTSRAVNLPSFSLDSSSDNEINPHFQRSTKSNRASSSSIECLGSSDDSGIMDDRTPAAVFQGRSRPKRRTSYINRMLSRTSANPPSRWFPHYSIGLRRSSPVISLRSTSLGDVEAADDEVQIISSKAAEVECINLVDETSNFSNEQNGESNEISVGIERRKRKRSQSFRRKDFSNKKFNAKEPSSSNSRDNENMEFESWLSAVERVDRTSRQNSRRNSAEDIRNQDESVSENRKESPAKRKKGSLRKDSARLNRTVFNDDINMMEWKKDYEKRRKNDTYFPFEKNMKIFADDTSDDDDENFERARAMSMVYNRPKEKKSPSDQEEDASTSGSSCGGTSSSSTNDS